MSGTHGQAEDVTTFAAVRCVDCGAESHTLYDGGEYCDGCTKRVERWRGEGPSVLALVGDRSGPSLWRIFQPFKALQAAGYPAMTRLRN